MPPKKHFINRLREDQEIADVFLVHLKQLTLGRTGRNYLRLTLGDRTGRIEARVWEGAEELSQRFNQGDLVYVTGAVNSYQGVLQIKAGYVELMDDLKNVDWADFLPSAERPAEEMLEELKALLSTIENPGLKELVGLFLSDGEIMEPFKRAPAAVAMHHAYISGLLEHTLGVVKLADAVSGLYPVDRDLLMAASFIHDLGKLKELSYSASFDYTEEGRLLGHLVMGSAMIREKCALIEGFPGNLRMHLEHLMLSHHGELEWGSPKRPKTIEALLLHAIDNIDAKVCAADRSIREAEEREGGWTGYLRMFDRPLLRTPDFSHGTESPAKAIDRAQANAAEPAQAEAEEPKAPAKDPETSGGTRGSGQGSLLI